MGRTQTHALVLISARELASNMATAMFVIDSKGVLVFYNEAAEELLGLAFADSGPLKSSEWGTKWNPRSPDGSSVRLEDLPISIALQKQKPAHSPLLITGSDGVDRTIAITAFPLFAKVGELAGAVAIFWEDPAGQ
ncbi:MAG TPA: PAS domain-containing protein [Actinomycetota bacterium]|nr:PAS domain-containing protein [Actinomycetota bacterium]